GDGEASRRRWAKSLEHYEQAVVLYRRAEDAHPRPELYSSIGTAYVNLHNYEKASEAFTASIKESPSETSPASMTQLGQTLFKDGQTTKAVNWYKRALDALEKAQDQDDKQ